MKAHQYLLLFVFLILPILVDVKWCFISIFLMTNDAENFSWVCWPFVYLLWRNLCSYPLKSQLFVFFVIEQQFSFLEKRFFYWLWWVFIAARGLSLVVASRAYYQLQCADFSLWWLLLGRQALGAQTSVVAVLRLSSCSSWIQRTGSVAHRLSCSAACGIFPDQGLNLCPLHWQAES